MPDLTELLSYWPWFGAMMVTGLLAGFVAGLLGVGGGIVIVPVLDLVLAAFSVDVSIRMKVAVATSLATIVATSWASARSHQQHGAVDHQLLKTWGPAIFVGVVAGASLGSMMDGRVLTLVFAVTALLVAANMVFRADSHAVSDKFPNGLVKAGTGIVVGAVSAMMGIGGGTLSVPILTAFGKDIRKAVGTASAIGFIIAIPGTIGYVIGGWNNPYLPPFSFGYLNLLAAAAIIPLSMLAAPWGAKAAHRISRRYLAYGFGVFLLLTSLRMFGTLLVGLK